MAGYFGVESKREVIRVHVKKCEGLMQPEFKKFSIDPQITSFEMLQNLLAKAFNISSDFTISYHSVDGQQDVYLSMLSDWDMDAAFQNASDPCLKLKVDLRPFDETLEDWDIIAPVEIPQYKMAFLDKGTFLGNITGTISNKVEKTMSQMQKAIGIKTEDEQQYRPVKAPMTDMEFRNYLDSDGHMVKPAEFRLSIYQGGVEPSLRRVVWRHLLNIFPESMSGRERFAYMKKKENEYMELRERWRKLQNTRQLSEEVKHVMGLVKKDVLRTDRGHKYFTGGDESKNLVALYNLLVTYAVTHPEVSYCQGMSDIASPLLVVQKEEAQAYLCFCGLMKRLRTNFMYDGEAITTKLQHLSMALNFYDPVFNVYMKEHGADDLFFCYRWLLLEMKREFPFEDALYMQEVMWSTLPPCPPEEELQLKDADFCVTLMMSASPNSPSYGVKTQYAHLLAKRRLSNVVAASKSPKPVVSPKTNSFVYNDTESGVNNNTESENSNVTCATGETDCDSGASQAGASNIDAQQGTEQCPNHEQGTSLTQDIPELSQSEVGSSLDRNVECNVHEQSEHEEKNHEPCEEQCANDKHKQGIVHDPSNQDHSQKNNIGVSENVAGKTDNVLEPANIENNAGKTDSVMEPATSSVAVLDSPTGNIVADVSPVDKESGDIDSFRSEENTNDTSSDYNSAVVSLSTSSPSDTALTSTSATSSLSYLSSSQSAERFPSLISASVDEDTEVISLGEPSTLPDSLGGYLPSEVGVISPGNTGGMLHGAGISSTSERLVNYTDEEDGQAQFHLSLEESEGSQHNQISKQPVPKIKGSFFSGMKKLLSSPERRPGRAKQVVVNNNSHSGSVLDTHHGDLTAVPKSSSTGTIVSKTGKVGEKSKGGRVDNDTEHTLFEVNRMIRSLNVNNSDMLGEFSDSGNSSFTSSVSSMNHQRGRTQSQDSNMLQTNPSLHILSKEERNYFNKKYEQVVVDDNGSLLLEKSLAENASFCENHFGLDSVDTTRMEESKDATAESEELISDCQEVTDTQEIDVGRFKLLPPPDMFGYGNPFLMFTCMTVLLQHRDIIINTGMEYDELAMYFDKMVRKHNVNKVLHQARLLYSEYIRMQQKIQEETQDEDNVGFSV